ncbi:MAG: dihydrolipoamide acetyltransferase family protein [Bacteroidia bacterium]|nr:dihydrolipoamide acetyltransferase family protein [Bacteroidia bacterium]
MAIPVIMPRQGQSVETCIITKWFKQKGDAVKAGDLLFSYETDKAAFDVESPVDGTMLEIYYSDGAEVPVLVNVALIGNAGETIEPIILPASEETGKSEKIQGSPETEKSSAPIIKSETVKEPGDLKIRISPRAKRYAEKKSLNYYDIHGSGPNGRIVCGDIEKALSPSGAKGKEVQEPTGEFTEQPLTNVRKLIARTMHASLQNSAQLTHHMSADVRNILDARRKIKEGLQNGSEKQDITLNDMICLCVIRAIKKFPEINAHFLEDRIRVFNKVHLGMAVDTPRGLMVPAIKNSDDMDLTTLSRELKSAADACKKGNINPELIQSTAASFTVSNLGNYGVEMFTPVINLPQCAILGVCTIINRPADLGNNTFGFVPYIGLSLTYDHRAIDGGPATLFLKEIKNQIEKFSY